MVKDFKLISKILLFYHSRHLYMWNYRIMAYWILLLWIKYVYFLSQWKKNLIQFFKHGRLIRWVQTQYQICSRSKGAYMSATISNYSGLFSLQCQKKRADIYIHSASELDMLFSMQSEITLPVVTEFWFHKAKQLWNRHAIEYLTLNFNFIFEKNNLMRKPSNFLPLHCLKLQLLCPRNFPEGPIQDLIGAIICKCHAQFTHLSFPLTSF